MFSRRLARDATDDVHLLILDDGQNDDSSDDAEESQSEGNYPRDAAKNEKHAKQRHP